jgi:PucR C-terminal helix-turn-helix domain
LHLHANTARYRLARIEERTGCNRRSLADVLDLLIAVQAARVVPPRRQRDLPLVRLGAPPELEAVRRKP